MASEAVKRRSPEAAPLFEPALKAKILIVDDDERNAFAAIEALTDLGHDLVVARSGEEALKRLLGEDFAVILLDLHMPGMDGYETAALIRARRRNARIPIVFLTAVFRDETHLFQAYSAGAVDVVFKPVDPFVLRSKVQVLVDLHLKTVEARQEAEHHQRLLSENIRVREQKTAAERALKRVQERQQLILQALPIAFHSRSAEPPYDVLFASDTIAGITGFDAERFTREPGFAATRLHPEDVAPSIEAVEQARRTGGPYSVEVRWLCADGAYRTFLDQGVYAADPEGDGPGQILGVLLDVTERRSLEEQLAHARKMEAVGQLTGGVAHDFNNLLMVILANAEALAGRESADDRQKRQSAAIVHAADRGRSLTRQLLAFSRRQHLNPVTIDIKALIGAFGPLMQQAIGAAVRISLRFEGENICARADTGELETALLNLAVNARDAMPGGGEIVITARRLASGEADCPLPSPGDWVVIEMRDTGTGISEEVRQRMFEPFFTTKEVGRGSGLGLSQVYGFVRQSGGEVTVESQEGAGSTFRLFLPASNEMAFAPALEVLSQPIPRGAERILVVEDDEAVLAALREMLEGLGYAVTSATHAAEALERLRSGEPVDLLFTDVVMPGGMNGVHLARAAREQHPALAVLLTSGYLGADTAFGENEFPLIDKPYRLESLATKLREVLAASAPPGKRQRRPRALAS